MLKKINAEIYMKYNFSLNHILIIQKKQKSLLTQKKWEKNKRTQSSTFPTTRILHIPKTLHKLLAFYKDHI